MKERDRCCFGRLDGPMVGHLDDDDQSGEHHHRGDERKCPACDTMAAAFRALRHQHVRAVRRGVLRLLHRLHLADHQRVGALDLAGMRLHVAERQDDSGRLAFQRDVEQPITPSDLEYFVRYAFNDARAGIIIFVNAMPETHQFAFALFNALDEFGNVACVIDAREHLQHFFIRTAV